MRLHEIISLTFYISTSEKQPNGITLDRADTAHPLGAAIEGKLEARRPLGCLPRQQSIYLRLTPGDGEFVYLVEPIGKLDRHHTSWLRRLQVSHLANQGEADQLAQGYWSGKPIPEAQNEPWEYRALRVKIVSRIMDAS